MHINVTLLLMYHVPPGGGAEFPFTYSLLVPVTPCVRALQCARQVMSEWSDLVMAFGQSDEFSFLLPASSPLYGRRSAKLSTSFVSLFSSRYPGCYIGTYINACAAIVRGLLWLAHEKHVARDIFPQHCLCVRRL